jgi:hypothetical protein
MFYQRLFFRKLKTKIYNRINIVAGDCCGSQAVAGAEEGNHREPRTEPKASM